MQLAVAANLADAGETYKAWLADPTESPATSFNTGTLFPYKLVDNTEIALNWSDLVDGEILAPINITELGATLVEFVDPGNVWTNVAGNGQVTSPGIDSHCDHWTDGGGALPPPTGNLKFLCVGGRKVP